MFPPTCARCERDARRAGKGGPIVEPRPIFDGVSATEAEPTVKVMKRARSISREPPPKGSRTGDADIRAVLRMGEDQVRASRFALGMRALGALEIVAGVVVLVRSLAGATRARGDDLTRYVAIEGEQLTATVAAALLLAGIYTIKSPRMGILAQLLVAALLLVVVPALRGLN